ncbi:hypothetical protein ACN42_g9982 [Penicillium freii]|uniref:Uncharacterized protein n=1 Tax=Penicillium freii TaxID=48697 RepID=A0A101MAY8_PENFR|nr:hypothetical protein ACN42_g9982 [Penicillium freii]
MLINHLLQSFVINQPSGRAVTRPSHLPWSSGDDFRLSLKPISAGDRGSIPRGRDFFLHLILFIYPFYSFIPSDSQYFLSLHKFLLFNSLVYL